MAEFSVSASEERAVKFSAQSCIFCGKGFDIRNPSSKPDLKRIESLFDACNKRLDTVSRAILSAKDNILSGTVPVFYHRNCRATFVSSHHIHRLENKKSTSKPPATNTAQSTTSHSRRSGSEIVQFPWKENCFICNKPCNSKHLKTWSMVTSAIDSKSANIYTKVLQAATDRQDVVIQTRLQGLPNGDLVAVEARYHRQPACLATYTNKRSIAACQSNSDPQTDPQLLTLIDAFKPGIEAGEVYLLKTLRKKYEDLRKEAGIESDSCRSHTLKEKLSKAWSGVSFVHQQGSSDLVCSSEITVGDALRKAHLISSTLKSQYEDPEPTQVSDDSDMPDQAVLHKAIGILRNDLRKYKDSNEEYFSYSEMTTDAEKNFVSPLLYQSLMWLTNKRLFNDAVSVADMPVNANCLHIACDIINLATRAISPKHLGLAVQMHHDFGSRGIIDTLHSLGYCISYDELRHFLTSAASHVSSLQIPTEIATYIPPEIQSAVDGHHVSGVGDNWDHNERTPDGKKTTHAMTTMLLQTNNHPCEIGRIPRVKDRSLSSEMCESAGITKVVSYRNPPSRPEPKFESTPTLADIQPLENNKDVKTCETQELVYSMVRSGAFRSVSDSEDQSKLPTWSACHAMMSPKNDKPHTNVAYNPILLASPTEKSTIYTVLLRMSELARRVDQEFIPVTFDLGILAKALEVKWSRPDELSSVILCEGGMHLLMAVFGAIGHLYGDAGLAQLLHESGAFAAGTVGQMLTGKDFDRAIRGFKLVDEVLNCRFFKCFAAWCEERNITMPSSLSTLLAELENAFCTGNQELVLTIMDKVGKIIEAKVSPLIMQFREAGRAFPTFRLWDDFLCRVMMPLKLFLRSTHEGHWDVYQSSKAQMLPLLFAGNRTNYARYMPVMLVSMSQLPHQVKQDFEQGGFVAQLTSGHFNSVWIDYALETTQNKELKGGGGIIGLTLRGQALVRWFLSRPITAQYAIEFKSNISGSSKATTKKTHREMTPASQRKWNKAVAGMNQMFDGSYIDPFDLSNPPDKLVNFATGAVASPQIQESMVGALDKGETLAKKFVADRLCDSESPKSFYAPLTKPNILTMKEMQKKVKIGAKTVAIDGQQMYMRLLAVNSQKNVPLSRVMSYENAPVAQSLFSPEGMMNSCTKSDFMQCLEGMVSDKVTKSLDTCDALVIDGHALVQQMPDPKTTLGDVNFDRLGAQYLSMVMSMSRTVGCQSGQIHNVFDKYTEDSTKTQTRSRRGAGQTATTYKVRSEVRVPSNWKHFLSVGENKSQLADFFKQYMLTHAQGQLKPQQVLYLGSSKHNETAMVSSLSKESSVSGLTSDHEEADTRIIVHSIHAATGGVHRVVIFSPDTDVLVLLVHHRPLIDATEVYLFTGHQTKHVDRTRFIPIHEIHQSLTNVQSSVMLACYCLSGCDTVSSLFGHGKKKAYKIMMSRAEDLSDLQYLGSTENLSRPQLDAARRFIGRMYGAADCKSLNELRTSLTARKQVSSKRLPPTEDAFKLHTLRALYQLFVWRHANELTPKLPDPTSCGYERDERTGCLQPLMMKQGPAAPELLNDLVCSCRSCRDQCPCYQKTQPCTTACSCSEPLADLEQDNACRNPITFDLDSDHSNSEEDE